MVTVRKDTRGAIVSRQAATDPPPGLVWAIGVQAMSDVNVDYEDEANDQTAKNPVRARMRQLEDEVKDLREKAAEAETLRREMTFIEAGVPNEGAAKYFRKAYDGEMSVEAIRKAAEEANLLQSKGQAPEVRAEQDAWKRMAQGAAAGQTSEPPVDWTTRINQAKSSEEVMALLAQARQEAQNL